MGALAARSTRAGRLASTASARRFCATTCFRRCAFLARFTAMLVAMAHSLADSDLRMIQEKIPLGRVAAREIFWGQAPIEIGSAARPPAEFAHHAPNKHQPGAMSLSADALYKMSDVELLAAYVEARRQFVVRKFARDTHRAPLEWIKAKMFVGSSGGG